MNSAPSILEPGNPILGVFGFLDVTLTPDQIDEATVYDVESVREHLSCDPWPGNSVRSVVRKTIHDAFRLQYWGCPLRKELDRFRLYYRGDMADALTAAYFLLKRGEDPIKALEEDYSLKPFGLLTCEDIEKTRIEARDDSNSDWWQFSRFYKEGDCLIRYHWPSSRGLLLVRGDRLVWEYETLHLCILGVSPRWSANYEHFLSLGGNQGFLSSDFVWPDPDWINPVTDEEENLSLGKVRRGTMILDETVAGAVGASCSIG